MKTIFIINPVAGDGTKLDALRNAIKALPESDHCEIYETKSRIDAKNFVENTANASDGEHIRFIACGGDGTINEVFTGAVGKENVSVSVFPCGSGNDFVKCFGGSDTFMDVAALVHAEAKPIDILKVEDKYSFNVTNFGFDTTVAITVNTDRDKNGHGSKSSYTKGVVKALITSMKNKCKVWADGKLLDPDGTILLCTIANGQYVGGSFKCAPRAKLDDGLMEVCLVKPISRLRFVKLLPLYTNGEHLDRDDMSDIMVYCQAKKVDVEAPEGFAYSLDGEIIQRSKFSIEIIPSALMLAVPEHQVK